MRVSVQIMVVSKSSLKVTLLIKDLNVLNARIIKLNLKRLTIGDIIILQTRNILIKY